MGAPGPRTWPGVVEAYRHWLPVPPGARVVSLCEGSTPLVEAPRLARAISGDGSLRLFLKLEGLNPTGSFKDRGMAMAMTGALARGAELVLCASTGNTAASAAAYAARAGLRCAVLLPHGLTAAGKLGQALIHGATVAPVLGNFDDALRLVRAVADLRPVAVVNSIHPDRIEGQKTAAFEVCDALGEAPAFHCIPVGNAGNITATWRGYREYREAGRITRLPRMLGFQATGAAPLAHGRPVPQPETVATAIRIGSPASGAGAQSARDESGGRIDAVSDAEILTAYREIAELEGVFCEPASAAAVAGLRHLWSEGYFEEAPGAERTVVCTLTGHGLKDPGRALAEVSEPEPIPATLESVLAALDL